MDMKAVVEAGGHGIDSVIDNVAKLRSALPEEARALADSAVGAEVASMLNAASERADTARQRAAEAAEVARTKAAEAAEAARQRAAEIREVAEERAEQAAQAAQEDSPRSRLPLVLTALALTGAAAAAGVLVWRRRQAAAAQGGAEQAWHPSDQVSHVPSVADDQSPEAMDPELAEEIDEVADELADDIVEAIGEDLGAEEHVEQAQAPDEPFVPGVADEQSPDVIDEGFAAEVDAVADEIAEEIVEAIEGDEAPRK